MLLALTQVKDSGIVRELCGEQQRVSGGNTDERSAVAVVSELNVSHRARRIVDVIDELQRRFLSPRLLRKLAQQQQQQQQQQRRRRR